MMITTISMLRKASTLALLWVLWIGFLFAGATVAIAQEVEDKEVRGVFEVGFDFGHGLRKHYRGLSGSSSISSPDRNTTLYATLLSDMPINGLRMGVGFNVGAYDTPSDFNFWGVHVEAQYKPFKFLKGFRLAGRVTIPGNLAGDRIEDGGPAYRHYLSGSIAAGWELPRLIGPIGLHPSFGLSWIGFNYRYHEFRGGSVANFSNTSHQISYFFRIGLTYTIRRRYSEIF